jgi:hypothetical protein
MLGLKFTFGNKLKNKDIMLICILSIIINSMLKYIN